MINILPGTWHLHYSTFPMWQKEGIHNVTFNYTVLPGQGQPILLDEVRYLKEERHKCVTGYDYPERTDSSAFTWRGKGLLKLFSSKWRVEWMSEDKNAIIISFEKTLMTPAGLDILSRYPAASGSLLAEAMTVIAARRSLQDISAHLLPVR